jgi:hypothetical protein
MISRWHAVSIDIRMEREMTDDLRSEMKAGFKKVDDEFVATRTEMKAGFKRVDDEAGAFRTEVQAGFKRLDDEFGAVRTEIKAGAETTRRHFDIVAEQFKEYVKVLADGTARNTERLDDHDKRLTALEQPRG